MSFVYSWWKSLIQEDSEERSGPPSVNDDATSIVEPSQGWSLERTEDRADAVDMVESVRNWALDEAIEPHAAPPILRGEGYTLGTDPRNGEPKRLLGEQRTHTFLLGKTGTGKSTFLLSQMVQDVEHGESVILIDPHGDLAKQFLSHIPESRWKDVIYINPLAAKEWGKVVELNFLEHVPGAGRELAKRAFMSALKKVHPHSWGYRMESIMRYSLNLLYANMEFPKLTNLLEVIGDRQGRRKKMLQSPNVDPETEDFWNNEFRRNFRDEHSVAALDKIYKLVSENDLKPMTDAKRTDVSFFEAMDEGKIIVIDIPEGKLSTDLTSYLGTLILMRIYQAATARESVPETERKPTHLYIDEAHRFMTEVVQDNMRTLRKFGVYITGASQNLQEYREVMENEVQELADTIVAFKCGETTARKIAASFPTLGKSENKGAWNAIVNLPYYTFYTSTPVGGVTEVRIAETVDLGWGPTDPREVVKTSLEEHGESTRKRKKRSGALSLPNIRKPDPIKYFVLSILAEEWEKKKTAEPPQKSDSVDWRLGEDHLLDKMEERYGFKEMDVYDAVTDLVSDHYINSDQIAKNADGSKANVDRKYYSIAPRGLEVVYPEVHGERSESRTHIAMICMLIKRYRRKNCYPVPITKDIEGIGSKAIRYLPDLLVYPPYRESGGKYSQRSWSTTSVFAVEAEAFPTGSRKEDVEEGRTEGTGSHLDRTVEHFERMSDGYEIPVVFAVRNEHDAERIEDVLEDAGANIRRDSPTDMGKGDAKIVLLDDALPADTELQNQVADSVQYIKESSRSKNKQSVEKGSERSDSGKGGGVRYLKVKSPEKGAGGPLEQESGEQSERRKVGEGEVGLPRAITESTEEKASWTDLVEKYKQRRSSGQPPEKLAEILFKLKEKRCKFGISRQRQKNKDYLIIRKYEDNEKKTKGALSINEDVEKALEIAEIDV